MVNHTKMKLGKQSPRHDTRTLQLANYLTPSALPKAPPNVDWASKVSSWPMMANDKIGDCTCAAAGHLIQGWTSNAGKIFVPPDSSIIGAYSAITGYDPKSGANDNGANELDVLGYWRTKGIAGHKITAFAALEPGNHDHIKDAVYLFGGCYIGVALPISAQTQAVWSVPPGGANGPGAPGSWGGHAVPVISYDARGLTVITWGALKRMTWQFWDTYCDESYAVLSADWIAANKSAPSGFDLAALLADLKLVIH